MRTSIDIDDPLMAEARKACGHTSKRQTIEKALRLLSRLRRQQDVDSGFRKYRCAAILPGAAEGEARFNVLQSLTPHPEERRRRVAKDGQTRVCCRPSRRRCAAPQDEGRVFLRRAAKPGSAS
jgi:hypothetical protein